MSGKARVKRPIFWNQEPPLYPGGAWGFSGNNNNNGALERCILEMWRLLQNQEEARGKLESKIHDLEQGLHDQREREQVAQEFQAQPAYTLNKLAQEEAQQERQIQELLRKIAEVQRRELASREEIEERKQAWASQCEAWQKDKKDLEERIAALSREDQEINSLKDELKQWKTRCEEMSGLAAESKRKEELLTASEARLNKALKDMTEEMSELKSESGLQEELWRKKEAMWLKTKAAGAGQMPLQSQSAVSTIGRNMKEMTALLAPFRPITEKPVIERVGAEKSPPSIFSAPSLNRRQTEGVAFVKKPAA